ncbi:hypothetical protein JSQ78_00395 [Agrococcus sp. Marseille-Q4369]|nr:hypothetical protein JSQ78_00395 [Agrococcus sp. Marseille-Q4369]
MLQGLVGLTSDFDKAGVFTDGPIDSEVLVRPPQEGSFLIEVVRVVTENWETAAVVGTAAGVPSLANVIWWATKSARAELKDYERLENGRVKVMWQDDTAQEIPAAAFDELQKRKRRRKKQLQQILAPLSDARVEAVDVASDPEMVEAAPEAELEAPESFVLKRADYDAVRPDDEIEESDHIFTVEARMSAINFDDPTKWKVKTKEQTRSAIVEDKEFLQKVANGLAIRKSDLFHLRVRENKIVKNGRSRTSWTVLHVDSHRRAAGDDEA